MCLSCENCERTVMRGTCRLRCVVFEKKTQNRERSIETFRNDDVSVERDWKLKKNRFLPVWCSLVFEPLVSFNAPSPASFATDGNGSRDGGWKSKVRANVHAVFITIGGRGCGGEDTAIAPACIPAADYTVEPQIRLPRKLINDRIARRTPSLRGKFARCLWFSSLVFVVRLTLKKIFEIGKKRTHAHGTREGLGFPPPPKVSRRSRRVRTAAFRTTYFRANRENEPTENFSTTRLVVLPEFLISCHSRV